MSWEEWRCTACKTTRKPGDGAALKETLTEKYRSGKCRKCRATRMFERVPATVWDGEQLVKGNGDVLKAEGMARAESSAADGVDAAWQESARRAAEVLIITRREFTIEDITDKVGLPTHRNATGAFMNGLARSGRIGLVGYRKGGRDAQHSRKIAVWRAV